MWIKIQVSWITIILHMSKTTDNVISRSILQAHSSLSHDGYNVWRSHNDGCVYTMSIQWWLHRYSYPNVKRHWSCKDKSFGSFGQKEAILSEDWASPHLFLLTGFSFLVPHTESQRKSGNNLKHFGYPCLLNSWTFHKGRGIEFVTQVPALLFTDMVKVVLTP